MKRFLSFLLLLLLILSTAQAEPDYSAMTDEELEEILTKVSAVLESRKSNGQELPEDPDVLYDREEYSVYIDSVEKSEHEDMIVLHLITINNSNQNAYIAIDKAIINGWEIEISVGDNTTVPNSKSRTGAIYLREICKSSVISAFDDIQKIDAYVVVEQNNWQIEHHARCVLSFDGEDLFVIEREYID